MTKILTNTNGKVLMSTDGAYIAPPQPMQEAEENDVNFYDYDGFRVASFTITEAKALTAEQYAAILPPSHDGLTFQEWNWTLNDITTYNRRYIDIGANYITTDEKTHVYIRTFQTNNIADIILNTRIKSVRHLIIEWGDGNSQEITSTGDNGQVITSHVYVDKGDYEIKIYGKESDVDFTLVITESNCVLKEIHYNSEIRAIWYGAHYGKASVPKNVNGSLSMQYSGCVEITVPRNSSLDLSDTGAFKQNLTKICFPKTLPTLSGAQIMQFYTHKKLVIPEFTTSGEMKTNSFQSILSEVISLPFSFSVLTSATNNNFTGSPLLNEIDIVDGWIPNVNYNFSTSSRFTAVNLVDFFTKLGTTTNAITLTFGQTNLDKLTADQKAIATNKGYTLA